MKKFIVSILNAMYVPLVAKFVPKQTFFYAICGGTNMVLDMLLYAIIYNFVLLKTDVEIGGFVVSAAIASFLITFPIIYLTGLWLAKNITFTNSINSNNKQAFRYLTVTIANVFIKYFGLKILISMMIWPSFANATMTIITVIFSFLMQKYYTFKGNTFNK